MNYTFKPMKKEELRPILQPGEYQIEIYSAAIKQSKNNNPQIVLSIKATSITGKSVFIDDWLLLPNPQAHDAELIRKYTWKLRNFCYAMGLEKEYEAGNFNAIAENAFNKMLNKGKTGIAKVIIEQGKPYVGNDGSTKIGYDKNRISSYVEKEDKTIPQNAYKEITPTESQNKSQVPDFNDDIPF